MSFGTEDIKELEGLFTKKFKIYLTKFLSSGIIKKKQIGDDLK